MEIKENKNNQSYEGEHKTLFQTFYSLVDDSQNMSKALLKHTNWELVNNILSIGGGEGDVEKFIMGSVPNSSIWFIDPSEEQCISFRKKMEEQGLKGRIKDISQITFQDYSNDVMFDRILSVHSWFYIGLEEQWLQKLLDLLTYKGEALIILPNENTVENEFSGDSQIPKFGTKLFEKLKTLSCIVEKYSYTKWLSPRTLFEGDKLTFEAQAFVTFISMHEHDNFNENNWKQAYDKLKSREEAQGIPVIWDLFVVKKM